MAQFRSLHRDFLRYITFDERLSTSRHLATTFLRSDKKFTLQWYLHYVSFGIVSCMTHLLFGSYAPVAITGALMQGFYGCKNQYDIESQYPKTAALSGAINAVMCCALEMLWYSSISHPVLFCAITTAHIVASKTYMCKMEGVFANTAGIINGPPKMHQKDALLQKTSCCSGKRSADSNVTIAFLFSQYRNDIIFVGTCAAVALFSSTFISSIFFVSGAAAYTVFCDWQKLRKNPLSTQQEESPTNIRDL